MSTGRLAIAPATRVVFVRNVDKTATDEQIKGLFEQFGTIRRIHTALVPTKNVAFVTYYDIRHAETALTSNGKVQALLFFSLSLVFPSITTASELTFVRRSFLARTSTSSMRPLKKRTTTDQMPTLCLS